NHMFYCLWLLLPLLLMMDLHPLRSRHIAGLFARKLQTGVLADPQHLANVIKRLNAGCVAVLIEKGVTRYLDRIGQTDGAVRVMFFGHPALEEVVAVAYASAAAVTRVCKIFRAPQTGERCYELECRSRRQGADRTVDQWIALVFL